MATCTTVSGLSVRFLSSLFFTVSLSLLSLTHPLSLHPPPLLRAYSPSIHHGSPKYRPTDALVSPRFSGIRTFARLPYVPYRNDSSLSDIDVAIVGIPFDTGSTFKIGARFGPESIRSASAILRPYNPHLSVHTLEILSCVDFGDADVAPGFIEASYDRIESFLEPLVKAGIIFLGLGGDHSVSLAEIRVLSKIHGPLALVHFDSHSDLWDSYFGFKYTHGTPFRRAVEEGLISPHLSIQIGMRGPVYSPEDVSMADELGFKVLTTPQLLEVSPLELGSIVRKRVGNAKAFLSFDVDFFDPAFAPGTGTPEVGGPTTFQGLQYLKACTGITWVGADVVEVLPSLDPSQITAHAAAQVGFEILSLIALQTKSIMDGSKEKWEL